MKARTLTTKKAIHDEVMREYQARYDEHQNAIVSDIAVQVLSNVLITLDKSYGWRKDRLKHFVEALQDMSDIMENPTPMTHRFTPDDNYEYIKNTYGIDLKEEFQFECQNKR